MNFCQYKLVLTTIKIIERENVINKLVKQLGKGLKNELNKVLKNENLEKNFLLKGMIGTRLNIKETELNKDTFNSLLRQEFLSNGLFLGASLNLCHSHCKETIQSQTLEGLKLQ